jgi:hypothetical protein
VRARGFSLEVVALRHGDFTIWGMTERILAGFEALVR